MFCASSEILKYLLQEREKPSAKKTPSLYPWKLQNRDWTPFYSVMAQKMILIPLERYQADREKTFDVEIDWRLIWPSMKKTSSLDTDIILSAMPKNFKNRARALLNHIMADVVLILSTPGSHITDLIKSSQRLYVNRQHVGQHVFLEGLNESSIEWGTRTSQGTGTPLTPSPMT